MNKSYFEKLEYELKVHYDVNDEIWSEIYKQYEIKIQAILTDVNTLAIEEKFGQAKPLAHQIAKEYKLSPKLISPSTEQLVFRNEKSVVPKYIAVPILILIFIPLILSIYATLISLFIYPLSLIRISALATHTIKTQHLTLLLLFNIIGVLFSICFIFYLIAWFTKLVKLFFKYFFNINIKIVRITKKSYAIFLFIAFGTVLSGIGTVISLKNTSPELIETFQKYTFGDNFEVMVDNLYTKNKTNT